MHTVALRPRQFGGRKPIHGEGWSGLKLKAKGADILCITACRYCSIDMTDNNQALARGLAELIR